MDDQGLLCETLCRQSPGWLVELIVVLALGGRALYLGWRNRQLATQTVSLQAKVEQLSLRPPPPLQIQLAPHPGLASLVPLALTKTPPPVPSAGKSRGSATPDGDPSQSEGDPFGPLDDEP